MTRVVDQMASRRTTLGGMLSAGLAALGSRRFEADAKKKKCKKPNTKCGKKGCCTPSQTCSNGKCVAACKTPNTKCGDKGCCTKGTQVCAGGKCVSVCHTESG
jgi:hypothetical protein